MITFNYENVETIELPQNTKEWLSEVIKKEERKEGEINYIFADDTYLLELNQKHLDHDYFTDIITFDYVKGNTINGDIFVSLPRISENAETLKVPFNEELLRVLVHGLLHLCGYKDKTDEEQIKMRGKEDTYLLLYKKDFS